MSKLMEEMRALDTKEPKAETPKKSTKKAEPKQKPKKNEEATAEIRNRRVQAVLTPSLYEELNKTSHKLRHRSVNETIIQAIAEYIERSK